MFHSLFSLSPCTIFVSVFHLHPLCWTNKPSKSPIFLSLKIHSSLTKAFTSFRSLSQEPLSPVRRRKKKDKKWFKTGHHLSSNHKGHRHGVNVYACVQVFLWKRKNERTMRWSRCRCLKNNVRIQKHYMICSVSGLCESSLIYVFVCLWENENVCFVCERLARPPLVHNSLQSCTLQLRPAWPLGSMATVWAPNLPSVLVCVLVCVCLRKDQPKLKEPFSLSSPCKLKGEHSRMQAYQSHCNYTVFFF